MTGSNSESKEYVSTAGIRCKVVNGETCFYEEDILRLLVDNVNKLPAETRPTVLAAQDARKVINELTQGMGGEMEKFRADGKVYLDDIRQTRFAVVSECSQMLKELRDVRQFFVGPDHQPQVERLKEFVDLCERLAKLKKDGTLDALADTIIKLS